MCHATNVVFLSFFVCGIFCVFRSIRRARNAGKELVMLVLLGQFEGVVKNAMFLHATGHRFKVNFSFCFLNTLSISIAKAKTCRLQSILRQIYYQMNWEMHIISATFRELFIVEILPPKMPELLFANSPLCSFLWQEIWLKEASLSKKTKEPERRQVCLISTRTRLWRKRSEPKKFARFPAVPNSLPFRAPKKDMPAEEGRYVYVRRPRKV